MDEVTHQLPILGNPRTHSVLQALADRPYKLVVRAILRLHVVDARLDSSGQILRFLV